MKRVLVISDTHCGHNLGLTHPKYYNEFREIQEVGWKNFTNEIRQLGKIDLTIINGDAVDGPGVKNDNRQHITTDLKTQQEIAIRCFSEINSKKFLMIRGTPTHVTHGFEAEDDIAKSLGAEIHDSRKINVEGCIIHCKHTVGKGSSPYGSSTPLQSSAIIQMLNDITSDNVKADIFTFAFWFKLIFWLSPLFYNSLL